MGECRECGGPLKGGERWCPRCHERIPTAEEQEAAMGTLFGAIHEGRVEARKAPWQADEAHFRPKPNRRYTRTKKGVLSFGLPFRIGATCVLMFPAFVVASLALGVAGPATALAFVAVFGWPVIMFPVLRDIWDKTPADD